MIILSIPLRFQLRNPKRSPQLRNPLPSNTSSTRRTSTTLRRTSRFPFFFSILQVFPRPFFHPREIPSFQHIRIRPASHSQAIQSFFFFFFFLSPRSLRQRRIPSRSSLRGIHFKIAQPAPAAFLLPRRALLHLPRGRSALPIARNRLSARVHVRPFLFSLPSDPTLRRSPSFRSCSKPAGSSTPPTSTATSTAIFCSRPRCSPSSTSFSTSTNRDA